MAWYALNCLFLGSVIFFLLLSSFLCLGATISKSFKPDELNNLTTRPLLYRKCLLISAMLLLVTFTLGFLTNAADQKELSRKASYDFKDVYLLASKIEVFIDSTSEQGFL